MSESLNKSLHQLQSHYEQELQKKHLRDLLKDNSRNSALAITFDGILFDFARQKLTGTTIELLQRLSEEAGLQRAITKIFGGEHINFTEDRAVMHMALRAAPGDNIQVDGKNVVPDIHEVLRRINTFAGKVRTGEFKGWRATRPLKNYVVVGIGGSYLGTEFVYEAMRYLPQIQQRAEGREVRFLANVDPVDFARATYGLVPSETLFIIVSKTFTTPETIANAIAARQWLLADATRRAGKRLSSEEEKQVIAAHVCAVSTNLKETSKFGITDDRVFGFWDWVGGRFSVTSAVGALPLTLAFGPEALADFLRGARSIDNHFRSSNRIQDNIPLALGLIGFYQNVIQKLNARAILPYSQALGRFPAHIQQLEMESNGKRPVNGRTGVLVFGEPGTNGQHSFYQLLHQGQVVPGEFIGFSKTPLTTSGEADRHDELMANFFAQPDALANGKTIAELIAEKCPENLRFHKEFTGDRPSTVLLFPELNPYTIGQLLAIYEHRTFVEGVLLGVNSFDQFGVELGKVLAKGLRQVISKTREGDAVALQQTQVNSSTNTLLKTYLRPRL